jgi:iron(III) transport system substrate-binding protein
MLHKTKGIFSVVLSVLLALCLLIPLTACSKSGDGAANPDGTEVGTSSYVTCYTSYQEEEVQALFDAFKKDTGIEVKYVRLSDGDLYARVQAEEENPQATLWFGTSSDTFKAAAAGGFVEPYVSSNIGLVPENLRDPDGYWMPHSISVLCIASNTKYLAENSFDAPASWAELTDPKLKDNVVVAHPATSGMAYTWLSTMTQLMGEDAAFDYLRDLDKNITQYTKSGSAPARMAGLGECGVGICYYSDAMNAVNSGYPLKITYPSEGTGYELSCMGIIKGCPQDEIANAQRFIDWALTDQTQEMFVNEFNRLPVSKSAQVPEGATSISDINTINMDGKWASENRERLMNKFETDVRGSGNVIVLN